MTTDTAALRDRLVIQKMIETRQKQLASCERMLELLRPEWDKFEARIGHDLYVTRDYADHTSAARTHRKELAALQAALAALSAEPADGLREVWVIMMRILNEVEVANEVIRLNRDDQASGRVKVATAIRRVVELSKSAIRALQTEGKQ
jgi:hypothetical protein